MPRKAEGKSSSSVTATTAIPERSPDVRLRIWASQNSTEIVDGCQLLRASLDRVLKEWPAKIAPRKGKAELALGRLIDAAQSFHQGLQLAPDHQELELGARREEWDPQKTTDAFVESNAAVLDQQLGLLAQTLHVNTSVLFESPRLCDAYEQIVRACSQLVTGAPSAFSRRLAHAEQIVQGLCLAVRIGWHVHHGIVAPVKERRSEEWGGGGWERRRMRMAVTE
ncbi:E3 ubiquitin-protein ligase TOM1-like [Durusdinium trenchii]|uniref:E3 ubiquitin-protein ligase TOM1-like n=1 Tax=Durusdinium trenchii TaxID=1381693 RepID=A0ABP0Q1G1_9DINO